MNTTIHLKILGTNVLFRQCLTAVLGVDGPFKVSELSADLDQARRELESDPSDILIVDVSRSRDEVLTMVSDLSRRNSVNILLVGADTADQDALDCMESGAKGYVPIGSSFSELQYAIEKILSGGVAYSPQVTPLMFKRLAELSTEHRRSVRWDGLVLTTRELEILSLIAQGLRNKDLAERLSLSIHTVKNHVHHVLKKLEAPNRAEAVHIAVQHGWVKQRN